jgi:hypothetical protein
MWMPPPEPLASVTVLPENVTFSRFAAFCAKMPPPPVTAVLPTNEEPLTALALLLPSNVTPPPRFATLPSKWLWRTANVPVELLLMPPPRAFSALFPRKMLCSTCSGALLVMAPPLLLLAVLPSNSTPSSVMGSVPVSSSPPPRLPSPPLTSPPVIARSPRISMLPPPLLGLALAVASPPRTDTLVSWRSSFDSTWKIRSSSATPPITVPLKMCRLPWLLDWKPTSRSPCDAPFSPGPGWVSVTVRLLRSTMSSLVFTFDATTASRRVQLASHAPGGPSLTLVTSKVTA